MRRPLLAGLLLAGLGWHGGTATYPVWSPLAGHVVPDRPSLRQGYETFTGPPFQGRRETICVPRAEARPDAYTYVHPAVGEGYLCRDLVR